MFLRINPPLQVDKVGQRKDGTDGSKIYLTNPLLGIAYIWIIQLKDTLAKTKYLTVYLPILYIQACT